MLDVFYHSASSPWLWTSTLVRDSRIFSPKDCVFPYASGHWRNPDSQHDLLYLRFFPVWMNPDSPYFSESTNNLPIAVGSSSLSRAVKCERLQLWKTGFRCSSLLSLTWSYVWASVKGSELDVWNSTGQRALKALLSCRPLLIALSPIKERTSYQFLFITFSVRN